VIAVVVAGCVPNPARYPAPSTQDISFTSEGDRLRYQRGDEELDEQDYYMLLGDKKAEAEVRSHRASGVRRQSIGTLLMALGVGVTAGTLFTYRNDPDRPSWINYAGFTAGAIGFAGGQQLRRAGRRRVQERPILDAERAQVAINMHRYGVATIGPGIVKSIELGKARTYCGAAGARLPPLVARDKAGREIDLKDRADWFSYASVPEGNLTATQAGLSVSSPLERSLANLGKPVKIEVRVKGTPLVETIELAQSLRCAERLSFEGADGADGSEGKRGTKGQGGRDGGMGGAGGRGRDGRGGLEVEVEAAFVTYRGKRYLAVVASAGKQQRFAMVDPTAGSITVESAGGAGGTGGRGGRGGNLDNFKVAVGGNACRDITSGAGGPGGPGGTGGRGGTITARGPAAALEAVVLTTPGGRAGLGGRGGDDGGIGVGCLGRHGEDGSDGDKGEAGDDGRVEKEVAPASTLSALAEVLATNPAVALEGGGEAPPRKRRRR
jgi:hypothetical protein